VNPDHPARATAALDAWYYDGSPWSGPGRSWDQQQLEGMNAALEAPDIDAALEAFPGPPGTYLTTSEQDAENRALMTELRRVLGRDAGPAGNPDHAAAEAQQAAGTASGLEFPGAPAAAPASSPRRRAAGGGIARRIGQDRPGRRR